MNIRKIIAEEVRQVLAEEYQLAGVESTEEPTDEMNERKISKSALYRIIKEEVEVVLTNEEAAEIFDLDMSALLDEMISEEEKGEKGYERPLEATLEEEDKWIQKAVPADDPDRGKFSAAAKKAGMSTCDYAKKVKNDPNASELQKDRAQFALNTGCKDK